MKEINYWERFLATGSVSDFLSYKKKDANSGDLAGEDKSGGQSHAGIYGNDGDGFKSGADWRIR